MKLAALIVGWGMLFVIFKCTYRAVQLCTVPESPVKKITAINHSMLIEMRTVIKTIQPIMQDGRIVGITWYKAAAASVHETMIGAIVKKPDESLAVIRSVTALATTASRVRPFFTPHGLAYIADGAPTLISNFTPTDLVLTVASPSNTNNTIVPLAVNFPNFEHAFEKWRAFTVVGTKLAGTTDVDEWPDEQSRLIRRVWISNIYFLTKAATMLTELNFANSNFGDQGLQIITRIISCVPHLVSLNLRGNHISDVSKLLHALVMCPSFEHLNLQDNHLTDATQLSNFYACCTTPSVLLLGGNFLGDECAEAFPPLFKRGLCVLDLSSNSIGLIAAVRLITAACKCPSMRHLDLNGNPTSGLTLSKIRKCCSNPYLTGFKSVGIHADSFAHNMKLTTGFTAFYNIATTAPNIEMKLPTPVESCNGDSACSISKLSNGSDLQFWTPFNVTDGTLTGISGQCTHTINNADIIETRWCTNIRLVFSVFSLSRINMSGQLHDRLSIFAKAFNAPNLIALDISDNGIVDITVLLAAMRNCTRLVRLDLRKNRIAVIDPIAAHFANKSLNMLLLSNNELTTAAALINVQPISASSLQYIDLAFNKFDTAATRAIIAAAAASPSVTYVNLVGAPPVKIKVRPDLHIELVKVAECTEQLFVP